MTPLAHIHLPLPTLPTICHVWACVFDSPPNSHRGHLWILVHAIQSVHHCCRLLQCHLPSVGGHQHAKGSQSHAGTLKEARAGTLEDFACPLAPVFSICDGFGRPLQHVLRSWSQSIVLQLSTLCSWCTGVSSACPSRKTNWSCVGLAMLVLLLKSSTLPPLLPSSTRSLSSLTGYLMLHSYMRTGALVHIFPFHFLFIMFSLLHSLAPGPWTDHVTPEGMCVL